MNTGVQVFLASLLSLLWGKYPEVGLRGSTSDRLRPLCTVFRSRRSVLYLPTDEAQGSFLHILPTLVVFPSHFCISHPG